MAVYTSLDEKQINEFMHKYALGNVASFEGIPEGITNTNYWIHTETHKLVLTIFEQNIPFDDLVFYLELMNFLHTSQLPCPEVYHDKQGKLIQTIQGKQALLAQALEGCVTQVSTESHCAAIGDFLGRMHKATQHFHLHIPNPRGAPWRRESVEILMDLLPIADALLLQEEMGFQKTLEYHLFPRGIIHADLFKDNALFQDDQLTGVIDFYYACYDDLLLDIAIAINAWCRNEYHKFYQPYIDALLKAYEVHRVLSPLEREHLNDVRRTAALRFWISRLKDYYFPQEGQLSHTLDPNEYRDILKGLSFIPKL